MRDLNIAGRDIKTVNISKKKEKTGWIFKIIKPLLVAVGFALIAYVIDQLLGINLLEFRLR